MFASTILTLFFLSLANSHQSPQLRKCGELPLALHSSAVTFDGQDSIYIIGGRQDADGSNNIFKFNIRDATVQSVGKFPHPVSSGVTAIDSNGDILYFGGEVLKKVQNVTTFEATDSIFLIRKNYPQPLLLNSKLNFVRGRPSSVTIGDSVHIYGGDSNCTNSDGSKECYRTTVEVYNMTTHTASIANTSEFDEITRTLHGTSAVFHANSTFCKGSENCVYIFGVPYPSIFTSTILRVNPETFTASSMSTRLPKDFAKSCAVSVDDVAYIFYGTKIFARDARTFGLTQLELGIFEATGTPSAVYVKPQKRIYIFGASGTAGKPEGYSDILCLDFPPFSFECNEQPDGDYPHPVDCAKYITCSNEVKYERNCPASLHFNAELRRCDFPENANCNPQ